MRGLWKAIALAKRLGESGNRITIEVILKVHRTIFENAFPEVAGRFRKSGEDIKKLKCIEPPPGRLVEEQFYAFWRELDIKLSTIPKHDKSSSKSQRKKWLSDVFDLATWVHYKLAAIHPFCEGNGRMARLMTNLILSRFALPASRVKYEGQNKAKYLEALCQIDKYGVYEPLKKLIISGVYDTYKREESIRKNKQRNR